jgi:hypothetical protein
MSNRNPKSIFPKVLEGTDIIYEGRRGGGRTDVDDVTLLVDHDVAIVAVLDLKNVTRYGIRSHRLDEIQTSVLILDRIFSAILGNEKALEIVNLCSAHLVPRGRIRYDVDNATLQRKVLGTTRIQTR